MCMNKGNSFCISESMHFIGLLKECMLDNIQLHLIQIAYIGFWIAKTPNKNYLAGFCWIWGNIVVFSSVLS